MSSSSVVSLSSFNLLFFTQVLTVFTSSLKYSEYVRNKGATISIPCNADGDVIWVKEDGNSSRIVRTGQELVFVNVSAADRGIYVCFVSVPPRNATDVTVEAGADDNAVMADYDDNTDDLTMNATSTSSSSDSSGGQIATSDSSRTFATTNPMLLITQSAPLPLHAHTIEAATKSIKHASSMANGGANTITARSDVEELEYEAVHKINLTVRTPPGPVHQLYFKASTILGFLIWRFNKTNSGGFPVRSFTAEFRNISYNVPPYNSSFEHEWSRMDPINIAPNVRQMEVYHLEPNTTYEFRIWANNQLGSGAVVTTNVTTLPETKEEGVEDGWDSIELIPNIILNPGFCDADGRVAPYPRTIIFGGNDDSDSYESEESDHEPRLQKFKRNLAVFFTGPGPIIKRI